MTRWLIIYGKEDEPKTMYVKTLFEALRFVYEEHTKVEELYKGKEHLVFMVGEDNEIIELFQCYDKDMIELLK